MTTKEKKTPEASKDEPKNVVPAVYPRFLVGTLIGIIIILLVILLLFTLHNFF